MKQMNSNKIASEQRLQEALAELPTDMSPDRDLWSGIERAIAADVHQATAKKVIKASVFTPVTWAASVVAAVLVTWYSFNINQVEQMPTVNLVANMERDFNQQKRVMLVNLGSPKVSELPVDIQKELTKLSSAQKAISKALANDPNNSDLLNLLRWTQKQELDLLQQLYSPQWQTI